MIQKLKILLSRRDKFFLFYLFLFSLVISIIEVVGISAIMPFIAVSTDFSLINSNEYYASIYNYLPISSNAEFIVIFGMVLMLFYFFRSGANLLYIYMLSKFTQSRYHVLARKLFENYMGLPYQVFVSRNSSNMTKSIISEAANLTQLISSSMMMMSEILIATFIYMIMLYADWKITVMLTVVLMLNATLMIQTVSLKIKQAGRRKASSQNFFYEIINRSFGNFKFIKLQLNNKSTLEDFNHFAIIYTKANIANATLHQLPRLFLEAIGFSIIISIIMYLVYESESDISSSLPVISMFVLALYRLMPSINRIMSNYNQILFMSRSLDIIHNDLLSSPESSPENLGDASVKFKDEISLCDVDFEYEKGMPIVQNVNISIRKGSKVAFIGESGCGKSTLVDIIIGLYKLNSGKLLVDGIPISETNVKSWREKVGYIPQSVYLFDGTVGDNVAFGRGYDKSKIDRVLKQSKIYDFLSTKDGAFTKVGEDGIMLSGGQKQRIAIARALYSDPEILVLDEATSALDSKIEEQIMSEIYALSKDKTLIIIAHRLGTIQKCDTVFFIENKRVTQR